MSKPLYSSNIKLAHTELAVLSNINNIESDKPCLVFVHGFMDNANSFSTLIPLLSDYQCISVDLAGHGYSSHRNSDAHYHLVDYAYDIYELLHKLNLEKVTLIGHSLGAIICSIVSSTQLASIKGLVLIESFGPLSETADTSAEQIKQSFESRRHAQSSATQPKSMKHVIKARCMVGDLSPEQAALIMSRNVETLENGSLRWRSDRKLRTKSTMRMTEDQATNVLSNISCLTMIILGSRGFEKVKAGIEKRSKVFKSTEVFTFEGGHHVHLNSPKSVAECIKSFLTTSPSLPHNDNIIK